MGNYAGRLILLVGLFSALPILLQAATVWAEPQPLLLGPTTQQLWGGRAIRYTEDPAGELTLQQVRALTASAWRKNNAQVPSFGFSHSSYWFNLRLHNDAGTETTDFVLLCGYTALDEVDFYLIDSGTGELLEAVRTGDHRPFHSRPIDHASFAFPFALEPNQGVDVFLRVRSEGNIAVPLSVWESSQFYKYQNVFYAIYGAVAGVMAIVGVFNLFIFFRTGEQLFLRFSAFALATVLLFTSQAGLGFQLLWPNAVWWNQKCVIFTVSLIICTHLLFSINFLALRGRQKQLFNTLLAVSVVIFLSAFLLPYQVSLRAVLACAMLASILSISISIYLWAKGSGTARIYTLAWSAFILGTFIAASIRFGITPYSIVTEFAGLFGALTTVIVLSMGIADRINKEKQDRIQAQNQAIQNLEKFEMLFENSVEGICISTLSGRLSNANPAFVSMLGYTSLDDMLQALKNDASKIYKDPAQRNELIIELQAQGRVVNRELELVHRDGDCFWASMSMWIGKRHEHGDHLIEGAMVDITDRKESEQRLAFLATHDPLTNLYNRRLFEQRLAQALEESHSSEKDYCVLYMDLDQFKVVNDTCGHSAGDILLRELSLLMMKTLGERGILARLGGDEFGVILQETKQMQAVKIAEEFRTLIQNYRFNFNDRVFNLGISIGVVALTPASESTEQIMILADTACYTAKDSGRNRVHVYSANNVELQKRRTEMELVSAINHALEADLFFLKRQAIIENNDTGAVFGYEILVHMHDEQGNMVTPDIFIPAAERYNLMPQVDRWIIENCFRWLQRNPQDLKRIKHCAINISGHSLGDEDMLEFILSSFHKYQIPPEKICFELTESAAIHNLSHTLQLVDAFRELGCHLSLDDFGTGFSSYSYLKHLPVDYLKIDGAFIANLAKDPVDYAMVKSINDVAAAMGMKTIAEFVENDTIIRELRRIGVDYLQGYGIAKPQLLNDFNQEDYFRAEEH
ncbi:EAL domain-containing protein [Exilibacterium tricleocarpae]|uniref:EAL domain-containing protein n=1 Tax=Exilibacterium tricleocarpae TaxID=2591008 RepID=A0A545STB0_9GAMM|nr:EAL domain-containing protein [Exilibacterium tricleocarpae]TQV68191.1 EAL domain-containing protein [Exilibacterium tricleocarpae]